ncbi:hypothetical protein ACVWW3_003025 [Bradyrhizobium sp. LM2.9]
MPARAERMCASRSWPTLRGLRRDGELKSYMDLFFLALIVLLCVANIMRQ